MNGVKVELMSMCYRTNFKNAVVKGSSTSKVNAIHHCHKGLVKMESGL